MPKCATADLSGIAKDARRDGLLSCIWGSDPGVIYRKHRQTSGWKPAAYETLQRAMVLRSKSMG